jgi:hypothetical protein
MKLVTRVIRRTVGLASALISALRKPRCLVMASDCKSVDDVSLSLFGLIDNIFMRTGKLSELD